LGLEIGFHVPSCSCGPVITRLGRNTDLTLLDCFSDVHLAFEMQPETYFVMLSVRTDRAASVIVEADSGGEAGTAISGNCAIMYGEQYTITIASYWFRLVWRDIEGVHPRDPTRALRLKRLAMDSYRDAIERWKAAGPPDQPISEPPSHPGYNTRAHSAAPVSVKEAPGSRELIDRGVFGYAYKAVDAGTGYYFAIKMVDLSAQQEGAATAEVVRSALRREISILERLSHVCAPIGPLVFDSLSEFLNLTGY
jgi:hypothetical protein